MKVEFTNTFRKEKENKFFIKKKLFLPRILVKSFVRLQKDCSDVSRNWTNIKKCHSDWKKKITNCFVYFELWLKTRFYFQFSPMFYFLFFPPSLSPNVWYISTKKKFFSSIHRLKLFPRSSIFWTDHLSTNQFWTYQLWTNQLWTHQLWTY